MTAVHVQELEEEANLRREPRAAKEGLAVTKFTEEPPRGDDEKVAFYTGLQTFLMFFSL